MPNPTDKVQARKERFEAIRRRQDEILELPREEFSAWCTNVATLQVDSAHGLVFRLTNMAQGWNQDPRLVELKRAEEAAVDQLSRVKLTARWEARRLTGYQLDYWEFRRPREIPRIDGHPIWFAMTLPEVVD